MNVILKSLSIIVFKILYGIFCTICSLFVAYNIFIVIAHSFFSDNGFDFQIIFFILLSVALIISFWALIFVKIKPTRKILIFLLLLIIQLGYLQLSMLLPSVKKINNMEFFIDTGICAEGIKLKDGVMSKKYCLKHGLTWDARNRSCDMNSKSNSKNK